MESDEYGNEEFFYATLSYARADQTPLGATMVALDNMVLQDLTMRQVRAWAILLVIALPAGVALAGIWTVRRRRAR